jgi:hypothetical protein
MLKKIKIVVCILCGYVCANVAPENGAMFNYRQIFFQWDQIPNAENYTLSIQNSTNSMGIEIESLNNSTLVTDFIDWDSNYTWFICGYFSNSETPFCSEIYTFTINPLPDYFPDYINVSTLNEDLYQEGITIMDFESLNFSGGLDKNGTPIWFAEKEGFAQRFVFSQFLNNGNLVGFGPGKGYEIDLDGNIIFQTPEGMSVHHQINKTAHNTYFFISATIEDHYCPEECHESLPDEIPWQGDIFREFDAEGNEIWSWNTFDYYDLSEYNPYYAEI